MTVTGDIFVLLAGLVAGLLSGSLGTGSAIVLAPILVYRFGPKEAVPILAIAAIMNNIGKVTAWRRDINWPCFWAYSVTGIPATILGAKTMLILPAHVLDVALGAFFLLMLPIRRYFTRINRHLALWQVAIGGLVVGYISGIAVSTGPLSVPVFLAYGLVKGGFIATEAACSVFLMITKASTFRSLGALPMDAIIKGLLVGGSVVVGGLGAKIVVERMSLRTFHYLVDGLLVVSGLAMFWAATLHQ